MICRRFFLLAATALALTLGQATARAEISDSDKQLVQSVFDRLVAAAKPVEGWAWPPKLNFLDTDVIQAYATVDMRQDPPQPLIFVYRGILEKVIAGDENRLALLLGHELSHITCKHVKPTAGEKTPLVEFASTRDQEHEADVEGLKLALAAGFSFKDCLGMITQFIELGHEYTSFEALNADHPSWKQRLALIDKEQSQLWEATAAFETGVQFLMFENYFAAERCFLSVTDAFPKCHEAWANLGYARLMQYCDGFDAEAVEEYELGPLVVGAFYDRPESLNKTRDLGPFEELWWNAVGALREALRLNPNSVLAASNLGIAYLVGPEGKNVGQAAKYLDLAAKLAEADETQPLLARAAVLANAGIADLLEGHQEDALARLDSADSLQQAFAGGAKRAGISPAITAAILYHRAVLMAADDNKDKKRAALKLLEQYLVTMSRASAWWPMGYDAYVKLAKELGEEPKSEKSFAKSAQVSLRPITDLALADGLAVGIADEFDKLKKLLGEGELLSTIPGTSIKRVLYAEHHVTLLVGGSVLGICLAEEASPPLVLRPTGAATETIELKVGMSKTDLDELLGSQQYDYRQLTDPEVNYRFYRQLGIAVRIKQGKVVELIVVQIPERTSPT